VELIETFQKKVEVWSFRESLSYELLKAVGPELVKYLDYLALNENSIIKL